MSISFNQHFQISMFRPLGLSSVFEDARVGEMLQFGITDVIKSTCVISRKKDYLPQISGKVLK